jgi:hypothetical protein
MNSKNLNAGYWYLAGLSLASFGIFMISSSIRTYGFFIDELYFMACAKRLAFGYIDQPPLSIALLHVVQNFFGHNIYAIRFLPAVSIAATVYMTGLIARRLGGSHRSMLLAGLAVMIIPVFILFGSFYSMNAYEPLIWTSLIFFIIKMVQENNERYWLNIGILLGIGLEMKHTIILYGMALIIGLLFSDKRRLLFNRWILWGGLACFILILPNLVWQCIHHFPSLELYRNSFSSKNISKSYLQVILEQIIFVNPFTFPLWLTGLVVLMFPKGKPYRFMLFAYVFLLLVMLAGHSSRPDRIASIYTFFMASGAVALENYLNKFWLRFSQVVAATLLITGGIMFTPVFCPVFSPPDTKIYLSRLGLHFDVEAGKTGEPLPQWLADRIGWRELAAEIVKVYNALPENEKQNTVIISTNYGEAGALELYGPEFGLPRVYCTHNSFHSWGPPSDSIQTFIAVFIDIDDVRPRFKSVEKAGDYYCANCTKQQRYLPIYVLRGTRFSIEKEWGNFKSYH